MSVVIVYCIDCALECAVPCKMFLNTSSYPAVFSPYVIVAALIVCGVVWNPISLKQKTSLFLTKQGKFMPIQKERKNNTFCKFPNNNTCWLDQQQYQKVAIHRNRNHPNNRWQERPHLIHFPHGDGFFAPCLQIAHNRNKQCMKTIKNLAVYDWYNLSMIPYVNVWCGRTKCQLPIAQRTWPKLLAAKLPTGLLLAFFWFFFPTPGVENFKI